MKIYISDWVNIILVCLMLYLAIMMKLEIYFLHKKIEEIKNDISLIALEKSNDK